MIAPRHWLSWVVVLCALTEAGWLAFDGGHALVTGDYVTPNEGPYAGQLGPWSAPGRSSSSPSGSIRARR